MVHTGHRGGLRNTRPPADHGAYRILTNVISMSALKWPGFDGLCLAVGARLLSVCSGHEEKVRPQYVVIANPHWVAEPKSIWFDFAADAKTIGCLSV